MAVTAKRIGAIGVGLGLALLSVGSTAASGSVPGREVYMPTRGMAEAQVHAAGRPSKGSNLSYHGGVAGSGVVTGSDSVYIVFWGSQWTSDPSGEATILTNFFNHVGGSSWNNSVTQYCQGVSSGTVTCGSSGTHATNPTGVLAGTWSDNTSAAPSSPTQSQLAAEAVRAAGHFSGFSRTTAQIVVATSHGNNMSGFGTQWCAWHSSTSYGGGYLAYTNLPYITDAGGSCGAGFNGLGANAGITIVEGHEFAETETDIYPNGGWLDRQGAENGDKCAWISSGQGASASVSLNGTSFPVQSLWSNATSNCVLSY